MPPTGHTVWTNGRKSGRENRRGQRQMLAGSREQWRSSPRTVKRFDRGPAGMAPGYDRCGRNGREHSAEVRKTAIDMKREHPGWGGVVIGLKLAKMCARVPASRTLQRWFLKAEVNPKILNRNCQNPT